MAITFLRARKRHTFHWCASLIFNVDIVKYYASGNFICSGRKNPRTGGVIICRAKDKMEVEKIIQEDPFYREELAEYEVIEFLPARYAEGFERFIDRA
ncbi:MAG: YciI family protein [Desulfosporosinus sp.]|nr:YciI family protein [Desulfosporosinus sp.]